MKTLSIYIIRKLAGPFFFGLAIIMFMFLSNYLIERFSSFLARDVPILAISEMMFLSLAWIFALAVPMAVLIASLMAFGQMSADNEITAMKANGYGLHQAMAPLLIIAIMLSASLVYFNDQVLPDMNFRLELLMRAIKKKKPALSFQPGVFSDGTLIKNYSLLFENIDDFSDWVYGVTIIDDSEPTQLRTIISEKATINYNEVSEQMVMVLYNGEVQEVDAATYTDFKRSLFDKYTIRIDVESSQLDRNVKGSRGDRSKTISMMKDDIHESVRLVEVRKDVLAGRLISRLEVDSVTAREYASKVYELDQKSFTRSSYGSYSLAALEDDSLTTELNKFAGLVNLVRSDVNIIERQGKYQKKLLVEIYKKYAIPFACIVFIFIGVPLGVKARHGGVAVGGGLSMLFFTLYWIFLIGGEDLADREIISPLLAMWSANILVGAGGLYLTVQMIRETTFLESGKFGFIMKLLARSEKKNGDDKKAVEHKEKRVSWSPFSVMRVTDRYFLGNFIKTAFVSQFAFIMIFVIVDFVSMLDLYMDKQAPALVLIRYYYYQLPYIFGMVLPISMLISALMTVSRFVRFGELTALKAAGVSIYRVFAPVLIFAFLLSCGMFWFGEMIGPEYLRTKNEIKRYEIDKEERRYSLSKTDIKLQETDNRIVTIGAYNGVDKVAHQIRVQQRKNNRIVKNFSAKQMIPIEDYWKLEDVKLRDFSNGVESYQELAELKIYDFNFNTADLQRVKVKPEEMNIFELDEYIDKLAMIGSEYTRWIVDYHHKIAFPFASLIVVLLGLPLATKTHRGGGAVGFGLSLFICFIYYVFMTFGKAIGYQGYIGPFVAAWASNVILVIFGVYTLMRSDT